MDKKNILLLAGWLLIASLWCHSIARPQNRVEEKLKEAEEYYHNKNYPEAEDIFITLSESFPSDPRFSYFQFMIAKCQYHLKNYAVARNKFRKFLSQFPKSSFIPACYFMLGNIAYLQGEVSESAQNFIFAHQMAKDETLKRLSRRSLEPLLKRWLSARELERLAQTNQGRELAPEIFFWLGKRRFEQKNYARAFEALSYYRDNFPHGKDIQEVYQLLENVSSLLVRTLKVGVLAPLSGDFAIYGNSLLDGIKLALSTFPLSRRTVELVVKDTGGDFAKAARLCQELVEEENVISVIGPLRSESAIGAAVVAEFSKIPLITPTASKKGLASLGDFIFQLSSSPQSKGKSLAEFVVKEQKLLDFVLLIPEEGEGKLVGLSYKEAVEKLGGKIVAIEYYPVGTQDFSSYLRRIKEKLLGLPPSSSEEGEESFLDQIPAWVDGFFVSAAQRGMYDILSRIANFNIFTTIIGADECGSQPVLGLAKDLDQKMIFTSNAYFENDNPQKADFSRVYRDRYRREPNRVSVLGFDCMKLLLSTLENATSPEEIRDALSRTFNFNGAWGEIRFDAEGENVYIPIYQLENGMVRRLR